MQSIPYHQLPAQMITEQQKPLKPHKVIWHSMRIVALFQEESLF